MSCRTLEDESDYTDKEEDDRARQDVCWSGRILVPEDAGAAIDLKVDAYAVSGFCDHIEADLETNLSVAGRSSAAHVLTYFDDMKRCTTKV
jgi:hypothetical protein